MRPALAQYRTVMFDSARWEGFAFRDGDVVISTPPKCGTTWTQMICALLIFQAPELPRPLDLLSPWLDQLTRSRDDVFDALEEQTHRRFIKSHTPLDGLPFDERVTYITVGRDPRDVAISWANHWDNLDIDAFRAMREAAVGLDDLRGGTVTPPPRPESPHDAFWAWVDNPEPSRGLSANIHHLSTFWRARDRPNVVLLHYAELGRDLEGQMRALAARLSIDVPEERWPGLVDAATFESMRSRASEVAPNATNAMWHDTTRFFNRGTSGQWHEVLDDDDLRRYEARVNELADADLATWLHRGPIR